MKLFLASTNEQLPLAKALAAKLSRSGYDIVRWWRAFRSGDVTVDRLMEMAKAVDGAVFILDAADTGASRGIEYAIPRDNLLFEYGLFMHRLGRKHCYLVVESRTKLPSDIAGLTYSPLTTDADTLADEIAEHFAASGPAHLWPDFGADVPVLSDRSVLQVELGLRYERTFRTRSLYLGTQGAKCWLDVIGDEDYEYASEKNAIKVGVASLLQRGNVTPDAIISLGPGHAEVERNVVISPAARQCGFFIPVDINEALLRIAIDKVGHHVNVPFGLHCDFEDGFDFVHKHVKRMLPSRTLVMMTGNTFGNLDGTETPFVHNLEALIPEGGWFLVEVAVQKENSVAHGELSIQTEDENVLRLILNGLSYHMRETVRVVREKIAEHLSLDVIHGGNSDIEGTQTVVYLSPTRGPLAFCRRYVPDHLKTFLKEHGSLVPVAETVTHHSEAVDNYILLLQRMHSQSVQATK